MDKVALKPEGEFDHSRARTFAWCKRRFRTGQDREWQLAKVNLRLSCADGGGDWRDNLLTQREALIALRALSSQGGER